jgi:hypothetical protein
MLNLDLWQPPLLKRFIRGLEPPLGVAVDLLCVGIGGEGEGVEGVINARSIDGGFGPGGV